MTIDARSRRIVGGTLTAMVAANAALVLLIIVALFLMSRNLVETTVVRRNLVTEANESVVRVIEGHWRWKSAVKSATSTLSTEQADGRFALAREAADRGDAILDSLDQPRFASLAALELRSPVEYEFNAQVRELLEGRARGSEQHAVLDAAGGQSFDAAGLVDVIDSLEVDLEAATLEAIKVAARRTTNVREALQDVRVRLDGLRQLGADVVENAKVETRTDSARAVSATDLLVRVGDFLAAMPAEDARVTRRMRKLLFEAINAETPSRMRARLARFRRAATALRDRLVDEDSDSKVQAVQQLDRLMTEADELMPDMLDEVEAGRATKHLLNRLDREFAWSAALLEAIDDRLEAAQAAVDEAVVTNTRRFFVFMVAVGGLAVVMTVVLGAFTRRSVVAPVRTMAERARRLAVGDLAHDGDVEAIGLRGDEIGLLARTFSDMTRSLREQRDAILRQQDELERLAYFDSLTGLPNRGYFRRNLENAIESARRRESSLALMFIDLDGFKKVNDTLGHDAGDELLQEMGRRLLRCVRSADTVGRHTSVVDPVDLDDDTVEDADRAVARLGGDEFTVLLDQLSQPEDSRIVAQRIIEMLSPSVTIDGQDVVTTPSVGVALFPHDGKDAEALLQHADTAMYAAKRAGKSRYCFYSPEMDAFAQERMRIETRLRIALERDQVDVHFQPMVRAQPGNPVVTVEALARWTDEQLGDVPPDRFVPVAEECGFEAALGARVLAKAIRRIAEWHRDGGPRVVVAVNVASTQVMADTFADELRALLDSVGLEPRWLELELTERVVMTEGGRSLRRLEALRALGVRLAIDDFGTGYSSLAYLKRFPIDVLKIDRRFVAGLDSSEENRAIVTAIVALARALHFEIVAEGVETARERIAVERLGVDVVQGWLFARAMPADQCREWIEEWRGDESRLFAATVA